MNFIYYGWKLDVCGWNSFMMMLAMMLVNVGAYDIIFF
jgi:hypothetical protein